MRSCVSLSTLHPCLLKGKNSYSNNEQNLYIIISFCFVQTAVVIKKCSLPFECVCGATVSNPERSDTFYLDKNPDSVTVWCYGILICNPFWALHSNKTATFSDITYSTTSCNDMFLMDMKRHVHTVRVVMKAWLLETPWFSTRMLIENNLFFNFWQCWRVQPHISAIMLVL